MKRIEMVTALASLVIELQDEGHNAQLEIFPMYINVCAFSKDVRQIFSNYITDGNDALYLQTINQLNNLRK